MIHLFYNDKQGRGCQLDLFSNAISSCLNNMGFKTSVNCTTEQLNKHEPFKKDDVLFCIGIASTRGVFKRWNGGIFLYNVDETYGYPNSWKNVFHRGYCRGRNNITVNRIQYIFDYCPRNVEYFKSAGLKAYFTPIGYHKLFDKGEVEKKYDVSFFGRIVMGKRRNDILNYLKENDIDMFNCLYMYDNKQRESFQLNPWYFHKEILKAKIHIHIHRLIDRTFENFPSLRLIMTSACNKIPIICEKPNWSSLKEDYDYLVFKRGDKEDLLNKIRYLLSNMDQANQMAGNAYNFLKTEYRFEDHFKRSFREAGLCT